ncbi:hypothetical protein IQE94_13400 [Synechocystis sp. PCC 7339]|uniref:hypothetical protein n=1 Tax=unclassified Synechocystis TaxID=2640012 RepID=UPI001BB08BC1|nr:MULTISPECIES: hypothetical protein [unclassified Synechocystis]QUS60469.1 hypothetical protein HTZ78_07140 [Synechocystis sp. PCC 7338]UAJ72090.1 hypothetical protein IQE94_13400 [Synechocystis sp. PCC 7339]
MTQSYGDTTIETSLTGAGISPGKVRSKDIGELITATEEIISTYVHDKHSEIHANDIIIGLKNVKGDGYILEYQPSLPEITVPAFEAVSHCIETRKLEILPSKTVESIAKIRQLSKKGGFNTEFYAVNGSRKYLTSINQTLEIPASITMQGETTLYGEIIRVGGSEPKVAIKIMSGRILYCDAKKAIVRQAGQRLYEIVGIRGNVEWRMNDMEIQSFQIIEFTDYQDSPITETFNHLKQSISDAFSHIDDPVSYFAESENGD